MLNFVLITLLGAIPRLGAASFIESLILWERFDHIADQVRSRLQPYIALLVTSYVFGQTLHPRDFKSTEKLEVAMIFYDVSFCRTQGPNLISPPSIQAYRRFQAQPPCNAENDPNEDGEEEEKDQFSDVGGKRARETESSDHQPTKQAKSDDASYAHFVDKISTHILSK